ncbi:glutamyl-tRNA amidotransferase subunit A [Cystobasidium minutum MCA 4210]|uniref:glutamyl-tRNA amidotransferase subunit A n=1 Tax=Cystobasidium minutum MCA 4210 TaxID=1397322 RepID=UPI0034CDDE8E|eukprot:jgi/Rhomi1/168467/fgenesh1_kg.3_\
MTRELFRLNATEIRKLIEAGEVSVEEYARSLLSRVEARDDAVRGWAYLSPELILQSARELDAIPTEKRGPLHGIAIGVKDVILTKDMPTQYNSSMFKDHAPQIDAAPVAILRQAGALIFGKTTTTEFAAVVTGGPARNPHDPGRTPGGSSSGSGAVVADFQVPISLGTQTGGSTIRPGSYNGIYAFKPTWNSITREGLCQYSLTCDTLGLYARSVDDLKLLAEVFSLEDDVRPPQTPFNVKGARFAMCKSPDWEAAGPGTVDAMNKAAELLKAAGAEVVDLELPSEFNKAAKWHEHVLAGEGRISFLTHYRKDKAAMDPFIQAHVERPNTKLSRAEQLAAYDGTAALRPIIDSIASEYDAIITPSVPDEAPEGLVSTGTAVFNLMWTILHTPVTNIPGFAGSNGMPIGLSLVAPRYQDERLLHVSEAVGEVFKNGGWVSAL